ncbi:2-oxoisovalerate dehydrogenase subunit alpha [Enhygromyxa salina]|uniref:2-oxoisovalerate dehydrogenase subunit alpha n=1 Tax=Enhygromyxa salina TaxID=215803 RepID=A0A2S9XBL0_9BACT|nr:thiamine pyrophosphate-dependent enzyme [Enhygromyxa salina]PRP90243.1 2-oxoisovalerate dehydrogenase subunit alpha [Enhygromyxa salina]
MQPTAWEPEGVEALLDSKGTLADPAAVRGLDLRDYYKKLVAARVLDVKLRRLELPMWASAAGEEAVSVAIGDLVEDDDTVFVGNRDAAIGLTRGMALTELVSQLLGRGSSETRGRGLPGSISSQAHAIVGASEALGMSLGLAVGHAHGQALFGRGRASVVVFGEGLTTTGMFHESVAVALAHDAPLVFVCKSQIWPDGAPPEAGLLGDSVSDRARAAGLWTRRCDGADALGVRRAIGAALHRAKDGAGPGLVEVVVTPLAQDPPAERDPVERLRRLLDARGEWTQPFQDVTEAEIHGLIDRAVQEAVDAGQDEVSS